MRNFIKCLLCAFLLSTTAHADEYGDKVRELLTLSNSIKPAIDMADNMLGNMSTQSVNQMYQAFKAQGKDVAREDVEKLYSDYRKEFIGAFEENLVTLLIEPYSENFSSEELDELITLLKTPTFQKFSIKMPELIAASQSAGEEFGRQKGIEIMSRLIAENPKFQ